MKKNGLVIDEYENKCWYKDGKLHREGDKPAIEYSDATKKWYKEGKFHREGDKPAIEYSNGTKLWYKKGFLHREGGLSAIEWNDGEKEWYYEGKKLEVKSNEEALRIIKMKAYW